MSNRRFGAPRVLAFAALAGAVAWAPGPAPAAEGAVEGLTGELHVTGMTFVGSRGDVTQFVLNARTAVLRPETSIAVLREVDVSGVDASAGGEFAVRCHRGELNVETSDFLAEGDVQGTTADGRSYRTPWVRYDHDEALLYTDAPVTMRDETGTFRGDGFRYHVADGSFRLLGNVSLVQTP